MLLQYSTPKSWIPIQMSIIIFSLLLSFIYYMKYNYFSLLMNFSYFILMLMIWFRELYRESNYMGEFNLFMQTTFKLGLIFFILSEFMFFFTFFWSFIHFKFVCNSEFMLFWPPQPIFKLDYLSIPLLNSIILLGSGLTITLAHNFMSKMNNISMKFYLYMTMFLGFTFLVYQFFEFYYLDFMMSNSVFGSIFYLGTGFHGSHVFFGLVAITLCSIFSINKTMYLNSSYLEMTAWYWHFVDIIWLYLFTEFYWWSSF